MGITSSQASIVDELFVRTADENYITARWCAINRLHTDFAWLAVHALEKYLKAILLYNGKPAKTQGHKIVELYDELKCFAAEHLPKLLSKPPELEIGHWFDRTPENFLEHLYQNGNQDNRYLIYGHDSRTEDLHMLDSIVFALRRLICTFDDPILPPRWLQMDSPVPTHGEVLLRQSDYCPQHFMPLDELVRSKVDSPLRYAALDLNLAFAPPGFVHTEMRGGNASRVPVILRRVLEPMGRFDRREVEEGIETAVWLVQNVKLPDGKNSVVEQIREAIIDAQLRIKAAESPSE